MLFSFLSQAGILSSLIFQTYALPFKPQEYVDRQKRASYSVVEVDGSAETTPPTAATPIIATVTQTLNNIKTVTASPVLPSVSKQTITEVVTQPASTKIGLPSERTATSNPSYRIVDSVGTTTPPVVNSMTTTILVPTSSIGSMRNSTPTTTVALTSSTRSSHNSSQSCSSSLITPGVVSTPTASSNSMQTSITTTTIYTSQPMTTSTTYDDGLWHTSYPYPNATSTTTSDPQEMGAVTGLPSIAIQVDASRQPAPLGSPWVT